MKKQNIMVVSILAAFLAIVVGYALFSESLTATGTASASGTFGSTITNVGAITQIGSAGATAVPAADKKSITVTVPKLQYPGAYVSIPITLTNGGTIAAKLISITETGLTNSSLKVSYSGIAKNSVIAPGATATVTVRVEWLATNNANVTSAAFSIAFNYEQA